MPTVAVTTDLPVAAEDAYELAHRLETFQYVVFPLLRFYPGPQLRALAASGFSTGATISARLWFLLVIPGWRHTLTIVRDGDLEIYTNESSGPVKTWNHRLTFVPTGESSCRYTDEVEIADDWMAGPTSLFIKGFFRYRQMRWRRMLRRRR